MTYRLIDTSLCTPIQIERLLAPEYMYQKNLSLKNVKFKVDDICETTFLELIIDDNQKNIIVDAIYRHPHNNFGCFFVKFFETVEKISNRYHLVLVGDINIVTSSEVISSNAKTYKDILLRYGLHIT